MKTRDMDVRRQLHEVLSRDYSNDKSTVVVDEFVLCQGEARADVAIINGAIHGYEIKSDSDTLERLPKQIDVYNRVFDTVTIVTGQTHLDKVDKLVPPWWGISVAKPTDYHSVYIESYRKPQLNSNVDLFSIAQFLWKDELIDLLTKHGMQKGMKKYPRFKLWSFVVEHLPPEDIKDYVRLCLKTKRDWKVDL